MLNLTIESHYTYFKDIQTGELLGQIDIGYQSISDYAYKGGALTPIMLERAIDWIEDHIQQAKILTFPWGAALKSNDKNIYKLAQLINTIEREKTVIDIDAVEQIFSRLVLQAHGQCPMQDKIPNDYVIFSVILIVREIMHHLSFNQIEVAH
jgi:hypothetical protein